MVDIINYGYMVDITNWFFIVYGENGGVVMVYEPTYKPIYEFPGQWIGFLGKIETGNHGFYHSINGVFRFQFSHHPILWTWYPHQLAGVMMFFMLVWQDPGTLAQLKPRSGSWWILIPPSQISASESSRSGTKLRPWLNKRHLKPWWRRDDSRSIPSP